MSLVSYLLRDTDLSHYPKLRAPIAGCSLGPLRTVFLFSISSVMLPAQIQAPSMNGLPAMVQKPQQPTQETTAAHHYKGVILELEAGSVDVELPDTRVLSFRIQGTTAKAANMKTGDGVDVEATQNRDGSFESVSIKAHAKGARTSESSSGIKAASDDKLAAPLPTILVRPHPPTTAEGSPAPDPEDSQRKFVEQAREAASALLRKLPDYVCQESIQRYASETREPNWTVVDEVSMEVVFEDRKEAYRKIVINGKPSKKLPEESGAWSSGEFGTIMGDLFARATLAQFKYEQAGTIEDQPASIYDFQVNQPHSAWRIQVPGQYILPSYQGWVWLGQQSANTLRIEMQAKNIPRAFPYLTVETAVDYDYIVLGTAGKFLLPAHAEVLSCSRGTTQCGRNVIAFHDCHKFTGESRIQFNQ